MIARICSAWRERESLSFRFTRWLLDSGTATVA